MFRVLLAHVGRKISSVTPRGLNFQSQRSIRSGNSVSRPGPQLDHIPAWKTEVQGHVVEIPRSTHGAYPRSGVSAPSGLGAVETGCSCVWFCRVRPSSTRWVGRDNAAPHTHTRTHTHTKRNAAPVPCTVVLPFTCAMMQCLSACVQMQYTRAGTWIQTCSVQNSFFKDAAPIILIHTPNVSRIRT